MTDLAAIVANSTFAVADGRYAYVKARSVGDSGAHFLVARDRDEITVVTEERHVAALDVIERNRDTYALIALHVSVPFYSVGFLAAVCRAIADAGLDVLVVSTYSKDYILVRHDARDQAATALRRMGLQPAATGG